MLHKSSQARQGRYETVLAPSDAFIDSVTWCCTEGQEGPITKAELKQAFARGQVGLSTPFWAAGMPEPKPMASIRELRWLVSHRLGTPSSFGAVVYYLECSKWNLSLLYHLLLVMTMCEQGVLLLHATRMLCNDQVLTRDRLVAHQLVP